MNFSFKYGVAVIIFLLLATQQVEGQNKLQVGLEFEYGRNTNFESSDMTQSDFRAPNFKFYTLGPSVRFGYKKHRLLLGTYINSTHSIRLLPKDPLLIGWKVSYQYNLLHLYDKWDIDLTWNHNYATFLYGNSIYFRPLNEAEQHNDGFINKLSYSSIGFKIHYWISNRFALYSNFNFGIYYNRAFALQFRAIVNDLAPSAMVKFGLTIPLTEIPFK
jgi:hypothetical protein